VITQADSVRSYISAAFNFGLRSANDYTQKMVGRSWGLIHNPVLAIPADREADRVGNRFLDPTELRTFWLWLEKHKKTALMAWAMLLRISTGQRSIEILRIRSDGYDKSAATLFWPKTKNKLPHLIPLPRQAVDLLRELPPNRHGLFFPNQYDPERPADLDSLRDLVDRFLDDHPDFQSFTPRDIRRTWKTLTGDAGISKEDRDRLQNHVKGDVSSRHSDRYEYLAEKRAAMATWEAYLDRVIAGEIKQVGQRASNVVPFPTGDAA
jgi:integrase